MIERISTIVEQPQDFATATAAPERLGNPTTFTDNMRLPVHRWFRYPAGYSAAWVANLLTADRRSASALRVLDPFAGSGTTLIAAEAIGADATGLEPHPFVVKVANAKLAWRESPDAFRDRASAVLGLHRPEYWRDPPALMAKAYPAETLAALCGLRSAAERVSAGDEVDEVVWLALVGILRACSPVGTAQWQYVLPNKTKARVADPLEAFAAITAMMEADMRAMPDPRGVPRARLLAEDARAPASLEPGWATHVITSPPYPNNYDYADATRLEMTFFGDVESWADLQNKVRRHLLHSCSQHMPGYDTRTAFADPRLDPIRDELVRVYERLEAERGHHGGRKAYHTMVLAYFRDLAHVWSAVRLACADDAQVVFVVGDSAPYGVHVPVERWLGELALSAGFSSWGFTKVRDRNTKWKNRKHRVPLHEGLLVVSS